MAKYKVTYRGVQLEIERLSNGKFRKPSLSRFTKQGSGVTWLDDGRIPHGGQVCGTSPSHTMSDGWDRPWHHDDEARERIYQAKLAGNLKAQISGRFPANLLVSDNAVDDGRVTNPSWRRAQPDHEYANSVFPKPALDRKERGHPDSGSFSRYFSLDAWWAEKLKSLPESVQRTFPFLVVPKAGKKEKNLGIEGTFKKPGPQAKQTGHGNLQNSPGFERFDTYNRNNHPTVKPLKLMSYLITLGSRPGDLILDPFAGTCTTAMAAKMLGRDWLMIEIDEQWCEIGQRWIEAVQEKLL